MLRCYKFVRSAGRRAGLKHFPQNPRPKTQHFDFTQQVPTAATLQNAQSTWVQERGNIKILEKTTKERALRFVLFAKYYSGDQVETDMDKW
jgi:hypothetical protein